MSLETGAGSPVAPLTGDTGEGSPPSVIEGADTGSGSPVLFTEPAPLLTVRLRQPFATRAQEAAFPYVPAYSEDGGELVEVEASWPTPGPFTVQLRTPAGTLFPTGGCYSGIAQQGSAIYANASQQYIRFAMPKCARGTYDLVVTWADGATELVDAVRVVPRSVPEFTRKVLLYAGVGTFMERL